MLLAGDAQMNINGYFYEIPCLHQDHVTASLRRTATRVNDNKYLLIFLKVKCLFSVITWRLANGADRAEREKYRKCTIEIQNVEITNYLAIYFL